MIELGSHEFLSILDPSHRYSGLLERRGYSRTLVYYILTLLTVRDRESILPLSLLRRYFNDTSQIVARHALEKSGLITIGHDSAKSPTRIYINKVLLAPIYKDLGNGSNVLLEKDIHYVTVLRDLEVEHRAKWLANNGFGYKTPLPRTWCRAYLADLLYRCLADNDKIVGQPTIGRHMSRVTQWRARKSLARIGRIRREWKPTGHAQSPGKILEINLERIPTVRSLAKPHPLDIPPQHRFRRDFRPGETA